MLRRDFLKFLGVAIPAASLPAVALAEPKVANDEQYSYTEEPIDLPELVSVNGKATGDVGLTFDFNGTIVTMTSDDGEFNFVENQDYEYIYERGQLETIVPRDESVDFELNVYVNTLSDPDFKKKIKDCFTFNMSVVIDGVTYTLKDVSWTQMSYDMKSSAFSLAGVAPSVGT